MSASAPAFSIGALSDALKFVTTVKSAAVAAGLNLANVSVTGFSMGGNLAEYVASQTGMAGPSFAGSGIPSYVAPAGPAQTFISFVETGDPWANRASDTALAPIVPNQDHYGRVEIIGNPSDTALTSAILTGVGNLLPAMLTGRGLQATQTVVAQLGHSLHAKARQQQLLRRHQRATGQQRFAREPGDGSCIKDDDVAGLELY